MKFKIKVEMELELQGGMVFEIKEGDRKGKYLLTYDYGDEYEYRWINLNEYCEWAPLQTAQETADDITTFNMIYIGLLDDLMK